jgi:photosystem II stability/assembly factor-like uncharacterized protein
MHLNILVVSKAGLITGGELGILLYSTNQGKDWLPAAVEPQRQALINQVAFAPDGLEGMAVGHEGWILRSTDGGLSWKEVAFDENNGEPLMSIAKLPSGQWLAVGAFGRALQSSDEAKSWAPVQLPASVADKHLNRVVGSADGQKWLIVGERGLVLSSTDRGETWVEMEPFYNGSFYNAIAQADGGWIVYGMRGNVFRVDALGEAWVKADIPAPVSFYGHAIGPDGKVILVGQGGVLATSTDSGRQFSLSRVEGRASLTAIEVNTDGQGWIASNAGLQAFSIPSPTASSAPSTEATQ